MSKRSLQEMRQAALPGMSLRAVAALLGIDHASLSRLEAGKQGLSMATASLLADAYRVSLDELRAAAPTPPIRRSEGRHAKRTA